ncbi:MAG: hypothetical protein IJV17_01115 [Prevotella sp.]|nr:hypothetical protein [Prevotella sp.]
MNNLEALLKKMISGLLKQVEEKVPEKGAFPVVYEREDVTEMKMGVSHVILKVSNVSSKGCEDERFLDLAVVNHPNPYGAESAVGFGSTQDILARLRGEELLEVLMKKVPKLADDIYDVEMHPYG